MPCYYYKCTTCEYIDEFIVDVEKREEVQICEQCSGLANHFPYFKFRHIGPVFSDAMEIEEQLLSRKQRAQGRQHYYDEVDKMDIQSQTGWSDTQYDRWKTMTDKAQSEADNGDTELR